MNLQSAIPQSENLVASTLRTKRGSLGEKKGGQSGKTGHLNLPLEEEEARRFQGREQYLQSQRSVKVGMRPNPHPGTVLHPVLASLFTHIELQLFQEQMPTTTIALCPVSSATPYSWVRSPSLRLLEFARHQTRPGR